MGASPEIGDGVETSREVAHPRDARLEALGRIVGVTRVVVVNAGERGRDRVEAQRDLDELFAEGGEGAGRVDHGRRCGVRKAPARGSRRPWAAARGAIYTVSGSRVADTA